MPERHRVQRKAKSVLGWREWVSLPGLGLACKAKVDIGARSSALHAFDIEAFGRRGRRMVRFSVHPVQRDASKTVVAEAGPAGDRMVRNSSGRAELRPVTATDLSLGGEIWHIEITLTRRDVMGFRMLLGRQAIRGRFVVDPARSFLLGPGPAGAGGAGRGGGP
jgi:hypothetical protein